MRTLTIVLCLTFAGMSGAADRGTTDRADLDLAEAQRLVELADQAASPERRQIMLTRALELAPDYEPAQWSAGRVRVAGSWLPVEEAQAQNASDPTVNEYEVLRAAASDSLRDQRRLARWCERREMADAARWHWSRVLEVAPRDADALRALDLAWREGEHVSQDEARDRDRQSASQGRLEREWRRRLARWVKQRVVADGRVDPAAQALADRFDEAAVKPFEAMLGQLPASALPHESRRAQLAMRYTEALEETPTFYATQALIRLAVMGPGDWLRERASTAVAKRPPNESVPVLLAELRSPAVGATSLRFDPARGVMLRQDIVVEGEERDAALHRVRVFATDPSEVTRMRRPADAVERATENFAASVRSLGRLQREARAFEERVIRQNASVETTNERVFAVLRRATGQDFDTPREWWDHWAAYDGYEVPESRPVDRQYDVGAAVYDSDTATYRPPTPPAPRCECFVAGTPVWTNRGLAPIETIERGDFVLAKDVQTGELSFRGVLDTTVRQPSPMVRVETDREAIVATVGHAFWVADAGWRKAAELSAGTKLLGPQGPVEVTAVVSAEEAPAHNLVVEGAATYFVGEGGVLVHDNTRRRADRERLASR
ncbi:MAG: polymorphic toxin-type HINT domain-containing protein [Planctomycetota bacterium]